MLVTVEVLSTSACYPGRSALAALLNNTPAQRLSSFTIVIVRFLVWASLDYILHRPPA